MALDGPRWRPRTVEDSIDAGVHPAVAAMRRKAAGHTRTVEDAITGRKVAHLIGQNRAPGIDVARLGSDPTYNPMNFFKQAGKHGVNPLREVMLAGKDGPTLPEGSEKSKKDKKKKSKKDKKKKDGKKSKKSKKSKKKKSSSSSSSSSCSSSSSSSSSGGSSSEPAAKKRKTDKEKKKKG
mmetsp:Transcript_40808/g.118222  ORF Transcript_40808/g.118222 Transcript_40808/m.118222 type:complete len:180 (-) Transcript_40808:50-589(-)